MYYKPSIKEVREIQALAKIIGEDDIHNLRSDYFISKKLHVYSLGLEPQHKQIFHVSVWTEGKNNPTSACVYAGEINMIAFDNMKNYRGKFLEQSKIMQGRF